jgi:hypothetical protein
VAACCLPLPGAGGMYCSPVNKFSTPGSDFTRKLDIWRGEVYVAREDFFEYRLGLARGVVSSS